MLVLNFKIKLEIVEILRNTKNVTVAILKERNPIAIGLSSVWFQPSQTEK